jgi:hypothetical protein
METWAKAIPQVQFLCICDDNKQVAIAIHYMIQFQHVTNAVIPSNQFRIHGYGQLGCSGFVVIDKHGHFVNLKTKAYLEYGEYAFKHVDAILTTLLEDDDGKQHEEESKDEEDVFKQPILHVASTGIIAMDQEHKECTDAMNNVISNPSSKENLSTLYHILKSHFSHEEHLMKQFFMKETTKDDSTISMSIVEADMNDHIVEMHMNDHRRILEPLHKELNRISDISSTCTTNSGGGGAASGTCKSCHELNVDLSVIYKLSVTFRVHAEQFDKLYDGVIPSYAH